MAGYCVVADCSREVEASDLCSLHRKRQQRGTVLSAPVAEKLGPWHSLMEAALNFADAEVTEEFELARSRLRGAALSYAGKYLKRAAEK